jgi:DNA-binding response OmpR family regulator
MRLLVIEDNQALVSNLFEYFEARGHTMDAAPDGVSGLHLAATRQYDAVILDWMLPGLEGPAVCERLRRDANVGTPIVMLTAKGELDHKLEGFAAGADDYLAKPFALRELEARLDALVRRARQGVGAPTVLVVADLRYDSRTQEAWRGHERIRLGRIARKLLELLLRESPGVVSREALEYEIWGDDVPDGDQLRSHMSMLRRALDRTSAVKLIHTVHGTGYRIAEIPVDA